MMIEAKKYNGRTEFLRWQVRIPEQRLGQWPVCVDIKDALPPRNWKLEKLLGHAEWNKLYPNAKTPEGIPDPATEYVQVERLIGYGSNRKAAEAMAKQTLAKQQ